MEESAVSTESPVSTAPNGDAFSEPLHSADELMRTPADSLPEAFQPVNAPVPKAKKGIGVVFIYLILVIILCVLGWMYRDSLKPSLQTAFPSLSLDEAKIPQKVRQNALPVRPRKIKPLNQPIVQIEELSKTDVKPTSEKESQPEIKPVKNSIPNDLPKPAIPQKQEEKSEIVLPDPTVESEQKSIKGSEPSLPDSTIFPEPEVVPLFEVIEAPLPAGTDSDLSVSTVSFRVDHTEDGSDQVLIEGQIQNNSPDKKSIPVLTVLAVNKEGQILAQKKVYTASDYLESNVQIPFYTSITPAPVGLDHVEVKF